MPAAPFGAVIVFSLPSANAIVVLDEPMSNGFVHQLLFLSVKPSKVIFAVLALTTMRSVCVVPLIVNAASVKIVITWLDSS